MAHLLSFYILSAKAITSFIAEIVPLTSTKHYYIFILHAGKFCLKCN